MVIVTDLDGVAYDVTDNGTAEEIVDWLRGNAGALADSWLETDHGWIRADRIVFVEDREAT